MQRCLVRVEHERRGWSGVVGGGGDGGGLGGGEVVEPGIALVVSVENWWRNRSIVLIYCAHNLVIWTGHCELSEIMENVENMIEM